MAKTSTDAFKSSAALNSSGGITRFASITRFPSISRFQGSLGGVASRGGVIVACATAAVIGYLALAGRGTDFTGNVLASGYGRALADADTSWSSAASGKSSANLWLSGLGDQPIAMRKAVAIGDRITVANNSRTDVFEVVNLEQIDGEPLGLQATRIQVVTARVDGNASGGHASVSGETVRFLFAVDDARPVPAQPKPDKVL